MDDSVSVPRSTTNLPRDEGDRITVIFTSAIKKKKKKIQHFQRELGTIYWTFMSWRHMTRLDDMRRLFVAAKVLMTRLSNHTRSDCHRSRSAGSE